METNQLKVGIVGAHRGSSYFQPFQAIAETTVAAVCDINEETLQSVAERFDVPQQFTDYGAMLDAVDLVVLATPENLHVPQSIEALAAGKHVISEVTAAVKLEECYDLVRAVRKSSAKYTMAENTCYSKSNVLIRSMVEAGMFGDVYFGEGEYLHNIKSLHHDAEGNPTWRYYWQVGINRCNYATHSLGPVLQWFGSRVASVCCLGTGVNTDPEHAMEDTVMMLCKTDCGGLIKIRIDMLSNRPANSYFSLQGTDGCYESSRGLGAAPKIWLSEFGISEQWRPLSQFEDVLPERWKNPPVEAQNAGDLGEYFKVRDFVDSILTDTEPPMDVYTAMDFTVPGLVSEQSIANGGAPMEVPDFRAIE